MAGRAGCRLCHTNPPQERHHRLCIADLSRFDHPEGVAGFHGHHPGLLLLGAIGISLAPDQILGGEQPDSLVGVARRREYLPQIHQPPGPKAGLFPQLPPGRVVRGGFALLELSGRDLQHLLCHSRPELADERHLLIPNRKHSHPSPVADHIPDYRVSPSGQKMQSLVGEDLPQPHVANAEQPEAHRGRGVATSAREAWSSRRPRWSAAFSMKPRKSG